MVDKTKTDLSANAGAYGGEGWQGRAKTHQAEIGSLWRSCGIDSEWGDLRTVMLHQPGAELNVPADQVDQALLLAPVDVAKAAEEHAAMAELYRTLGVDVVAVDPPGPATPNQMFCADLFVMTPQGAILARPASVARAGEEVAVARRLADVGVPVLRTLTGNAVFEGADLMWLDPTTAIIGRGHRTNSEAIGQISATLAEIGCELVVVDMPIGTMHLMGMLRIPAHDLAVCWHHRTPFAAVDALNRRGYEVIFVPDADEHQPNRALNFVTLSDRRILMVDGLDQARRHYEKHGIECLTTPTDELAKAAGNVGCLTGIVERSPVQ